MKTLWALVGCIIAIISKTTAVTVSSDVLSSSAVDKDDDKVHHKRQLNRYLSGYPSGYPLDFPYGPIDLGDEFDFYRSHFGPGLRGYDDLPAYQGPYEAGPLGPNGLYPDFGHYANRFNYLPPPPPPQQGPPIPLPPPPTRTPEPTINLNANPIIVDENIVGGNDVIKEIPPPNLAEDPRFIQKYPNGGVPDYSVQPQNYPRQPLYPYGGFPGSNDYLPPLLNPNQGGGYFPNYFGTTSYGLPGRPEVIPVQEPAGPEPFYVPPQLYRPAVSSPTPVLSSERNRTANTLVPTAPVSLGSGSLGIVRLNNGQYALGSGSLGYVGNLPYPGQTYLQQPPTLLQSEFYPGQRPQTFTIQQSNQGQQDQDRQQATSYQSTSSSTNNQQQSVQPVIQTGTTRHRPLFGPVQIAPGPGPGGYGLSNDGKLGFLPTNLYQNLPSIQHLGEPDAISNNKYNLQPLQLDS